MVLPSTTRYFDVTVLPDAILSAKVSKHEEAPHTWEFTTRISHNKKKVGFCKALIVEKDRLQGDLHSAMDAHSQETQEFSVTVFDSRGRIRSDLINNPAQRGSGVWGAELNTGTILYIEEIVVFEEYRRRGIAKWLLKWIFTSSPEVSDCKFAFAFPSCLNSQTNGCTPEQKQIISDASLHMFHSIGFCRVGRTKFLAYAMRDSRHPSRSLPVAQDPSSIDDNSPTPGALQEEPVLHIGML